MKDLITACERTGEIIRKLNFPVYRIDLAAAGQITDLSNNKQTFSFSCKKRIGLLCIAAFIVAVTACLAVRRMKKR